MLIVNGISISFLVAVSKYVGQKSWFEGPDLSGIVSGLLFYSSINMFVLLARSIRSKFVIVGKVLFWCLIVGAAFLLLCCVSDTYTQALANDPHPLVPSYGWISWILLSLGVITSIIIEVFISTELRDWGTDGTYIVTTVCRVEVGRDGVHVRGDAESHIWRG